MEPLLNPNQVMSRSWASDGRHLVGGDEAGECVVEESPEGPVGTLSLRDAGLPTPPSRLRRLLCLLTPTSSVPVSDSEDPHGEDRGGTRHPQRLQSPPVLPPQVPHP